MGATIQDWLLAHPHTGTLPCVLPKLSRTDLPGLCKAFGFTNGAEIGVWRGAYSATFCEANPAMHMLCVDPWQSYPDWLDTKNAMPPDKAGAFMEQSYRDACARLAPLNATIVRKFSTDAAADVPDGSLDLIYIDGNHVYDAVTADLMAWVPKARSGGVVAGHDYRLFKNKPFVHVIRAVQDYTREHGIDPWFVLAAERTPSWLWVAR